MKWKIKAGSILGKFVGGAQSGQTLKELLDGLFSSWRVRESFEEFRFNEN